MPKAGASNHCRCPVKKNTKTIHLPEGGPLKAGRPTRSSWPLLLIYAAAVVGGLALVIGFARFNALHKEFLSANFDSVHGARTLLKARFLIDQAARDVELAIVSPERRPLLLQSAGKRLVNAENYSAEGRDSDPRAREKLVAQIRNARIDLERLQQVAGSASLAAAGNTFTLELQRLERDVDAAELDRWGTLSGLNTELTERMRTLNQMIAAALVLFVCVMVGLAWALLRARRAEADLLTAKLETEAIQQTTLDASPIGIAYIDASRSDYPRISAVNRQMGVIFGYTPEMMPGLSVRRLYASQETYAHLSATAPRRLAQGEVLQEEIVMQRRNGMPFWCALSLKAIDPADITRGIVWTCEDITERKAVEVALQQERSRAEAANQAKSAFLANMSHELRTPFAGLFGLLDLLRESPLAATQRRHLDLARDSALQMQAIVNDILDFSKIEAGKLIIESFPFGLRPLISSIAEGHANTISRKGLNFVVDLVEPLPEALRGDPVRIRQIIDNLLGNATKFTEQGDIRLTIQSRLEGTADRGHEATLHITIEDTGIGIPAAMQARIFDKFTQADSSTTRLYGGTGLGLAICKQLAVLMGGQISLSSREGRGSRFTLTLRLPIADVADLPVPAEDGPAIARRLDGVTLLLAEDNLINRNMMAETLEAIGATVLTASNGEEAIRLINERSPEVVLMDCQMPGMDGLEATRRIRAAEAPGEHLPIIATTAFATSTYRDDCLLAGMDRFLPKPVGTDELVAAIHSLLPATELPTPTDDGSLKGRILLVEDDPAIREATENLLARSGCDVVTVTDGRSALLVLETAANQALAENAAGKVADAGAEQFDLVLMDCQMPGLDGLETTRRWRAREKVLNLPPLGIVAVTADDRAETRVRCDDAGMDGMLIKPFSKAQLQTLLADWLR
jgi:two-component system sensor histidine kinase/response regulator